MPKTKTIDNETVKVIREQRRILFEAVVLALLVHALLLLLFVCKPPAPGYRAAGSPGISFMNLTNLAPVQRRQLQNWLEYHEPSMLSAPHARYGYNQLAPQISFRAAGSDREIKTLPPQIPASRPPAFNRLKTHPGLETDSYRNYVLFHPPQLFPDAETQTPKPLPPLKYPIIRSGNRVLEIALSPTLRQRAEAVNAKTLEIDCQAETGDLFPRIAILRSSGNCDFDMAVLHQLSLPLAAMMKNTGNLNISIKWREENTK
ncbi:MAG: hypothetical protein PHV59_01965 [Victivallales bacterium]|nr:hypothetical protein [Victivallales bacterium]